MENKENIELTPNKFIRTLSIIHIAISLGTIILGIFFYSQYVGDVKIDFSNSKELYFYLVPGLALIGVLGGNYMFQKKITELSNIKSLKEKLTEYQTASIIKYASLEGPAILGIFAFQEEGNLYYLFISIILIIILLAQKPSKVKIESEINLNYGQMNQFNKSDQIIS